MIMETQGIVKSSTQPNDERKNQKFTNKEIYRLLKLTPVVFVLAGFVLTVVGNISSALKSCKIAGQLVITVGGLLLVFIKVWTLRQDQLIENANCAEERVKVQEQDINQVVSRDSSNDHLGPIHYFEIRIPLESCGQEIVPPSYEEAVSIDDK